MISFVDMFNSMLGNPPEQYQIFVYMSGTLVILFLFFGLLNIIASVFNYLSGKR